MVNTVCLILMPQFVGHQDNLSWLWVPASGRRQVTASVYMVFAELAKTLEEAPGHGGLSVHLGTAHLTDCMQSALHSIQVAGHGSRRPITIWDVMQVGGIRHT